MRWLLRGINFLGFAGNILYELFILIDSIVYSIAAYAIQAFFAIAELDFVANGFEQISYIIGRIMILCGVFALFKLSFTLINYIIDPGKANKSAETGTKLVKNILIAIVLLVSLNLIFTSLYKFQNSIIKNNVIPKIIYGADNYDSNGQEMDIKENAKKFANTIFVSLMLGGNSNENLSTSAKNAVDRVLDGASINLLSPYATDSGFNYLPFISFIVGVLVCYYFLVFAIELGIRMVKLLVLQILAPIPIIMSIDPTQNDKLKKFGKLYSGIYLSVFIRIFTVYLAFAAISLIGNILGNISETSSGTSWLVHILLIIAIFKATKELPKLIEDALGMKLGLGDAGKGFGAVLKGTVAGTAGLVGGAIAGGITGGAGGALGGAFTGLTTGVTKGAAAKNAVGVIGASTGAIKGGFGMGARVAGAGGLGAFMVGGVENFFGGQGRDKTTLGDFDKQIKNKDKDIEKIREKMDISNKGNDMRNNIENTLNRNYERTHGTLEDMLSNNSDIQSIQERIANAQNDTDRSVAMSELANKRNELTNEYNSQKDSYFASQLNMANANYNGPVTQDVQELRDMINDYNEYVDKNGLSDRKITDLTSVNTAKHRYELSNENYENTIKRKEQEKKNIEKQKSSFEGSGEYKRRNKREEKPQYRSRNVNNNTNGGNTN
jgi:epstein-barr nuclear antigen 1